MKKTILVDMDDVLADFQERVILELMKRCPDAKYIKPEHRTSFYVHDIYPKKFSKAIYNIERSEGFCRSLPIIPGGLEALNEMRNLGHEVFICTSPIWENKYCRNEKADWTRLYLKDDWEKRLIITSDKTMVKGDILIDDRPIIIGAKTPEWEHILYTHAYNQHIKGQKRLTWQEDWKNILGI